jgi:hypothetical protein
MEDWEEFEEDVVDDIVDKEDEVELEDIIDEWYEGCFDTNNGALDSGGDDCTWYEDHNEYCGYYDSPDFVANHMCCVCKFFAEADNDFLDDIYSDCEDTDNGALDEYRSGCTWYNEFPDDCGRYDNEQFTATTMCCACADFEEEEYFTIAEDAPIDDAYISDVEAELEDGGEVEDESELSEEIVIAGEDIAIEDLEAFEDEEEWQDFTTQIDPFDPTMDWNDIGAALDSFMDMQANAYQVCADTEADARDEWGNDCTMYDDYPNTCGAGDTDTFVAADLCCSCGGGSTAGQSTCEDTAGEGLDSDGFGCNWYDNNPADCELFDDDDFKSAEMCCACGGGETEFDPMTADVDSIDDIMAQADNASDVFFAVVHNPDVLLNFFGGGGDDAEDDVVVDPAAETEA